MVLFFSTEILGNTKRGKRNIARNEYILIYDRRQEQWTVEFHLLNGRRVSE